MRNFDWFVIGWLLALSIFLGRTIFLTVKIIEDYQMNRNYIANLNECRAEVTKLKWINEVTGITRWIEKNYPNIK